MGQSLVIVSLKAAAHTTPGTNGTEKLSINFRLLGPLLYSFASLNHIRPQRMGLTPKRYCIALALLLVLISWVAAPQVQQVFRKRHPPRNYSEAIVRNESSDQDGRRKSRVGESRGF